MLLTHPIVKDLISRLGAVCPERLLYYLNAGVNYLEVGQWVRARQFEVPCRLQTRYDLFALAAMQIADRKVLYLEFGVASGDSIRYWTRLLRNPAAHLHGFDSFEGLPSTWIPTRPKGYFSTGGRVPQIPDSRVRFFKGWFEDTLPTYIFPDHDCLFVNMDADLYSSTVFVLNSIQEKVRPGAFLYFDEFNHRADELRAFDEFLEATGWRFRLVGATRGLEGVLFQREWE